MKAFFLVGAALAGAFSGTMAAAQPDVYSIDYWEIPGPANQITWVEIHNSKEAKASGIAHLSVLTRKKGAPRWALVRVRNHIAITTEALQRSVTRPLKTRGAYPERYYEALHRWQDDQKSGKAIVCSTSIEELLKEPQ